MIKVKRILFLILGVISLIYYVICVAYAGFALSFVWIWLILSAFCFIRAYMLTRKLQENVRWQVPKWVINAYRLCLIMGIAFFVIIESQVIAAMNTAPEENLDYVIVLGAAVRGTTPTRPLRLRIETAYEYIMENPNTILIASGGKGNDERISEAECIRNELIEMGLDEDRILLEDKSTDTEENIKNSYDLTDDKESRVGLVTSSFHIWRSIAIAKSQGHENISGVPAKTLMPVGIHYVVREFFGFIKWKFL